MRNGDAPYFRQVCFQNRKDLIRLIANILVLAPGFYCLAANAEEVLTLYVTDVQGIALSGIRVGVRGERFTTETQQGKARIHLSPEMMIENWIRLTIVSPTDLIIVSPWNFRVQLANLDNGPRSRVSVVLAERGQKRFLEDPSIVRVLARRANQARVPRLLGANEPADEREQKALKKVADYFGFGPEDVDLAIRHWAQQIHAHMSPSDPYDQALTEFYGRCYPAAARDLIACVRKRREKAPGDASPLVDAENSLGQCFIEQGKYKEAAETYEDADRYRPNDPQILNAWALSLYKLGDDAGAERLIRRTLALNQKALGPVHSDLVTSLNNLAWLLHAKGENGAAESLIRRALAIDEKVLGPDDPVVARDLNSLAESLRARGDYAKAESLYQRALTIDQKAFGLDDFRLAPKLNNFSALLKAKGDYEAAVPLIRWALAIDEKALGPNHPDVARDLNNLASVLYAKGDYLQVEPLLRRALAIYQKTLGDSDPATKLVNANLTRMLTAKPQ